MTREFRPKDVRMWLARHGGNQTMLAEYLGRDVSSVSYWVNGKRSLPRYLVSFMLISDELLKLRGYGLWETAADRASEWKGEGPT